MKRSTLLYGHVAIMLGSLLGGVVACSPTKFGTAPNDICDDNVENCIVTPNYTNVTQTFKVGAGKVDILFVNDNSASMSVNQSKLAQRFAGFIENLDSRGIDYNVAITTTDLNARQSAPLVTFSNGQTVLKRSDTNRVSLFNSGIVRTETAQCEQFIKSAYYTYGAAFNQTAYYANNYNANCPSNDERGIFNAYNVISNNTSSFIRQDANLNVIVISNEDVRSGLYQNAQYSSQFALADQDKGTQLSSMINSKYPGKYWEFNSIITKESTCANQQQQSFVANNGQPIKDAAGNYVVGSNIGYEYAALSMSASRTVDGQATARGKVLSICDSDYSSHFSNIAANIADSARLLTLRCTPTEAPVVTDTAGNAVYVPYSWNGNQIVFQKGSEGIQLNIKYRCYTGVM